MNAYEFVAGSVALNELPDGEWIAVFEAYLYDGQTLAETSNTIDPTGVRVITFAVQGDEQAPVAAHPGSSAPYARGPETEVELVLTKDGKRKGSIRVVYS